MTLQKQMDQMKFLLLIKWKAKKKIWGSVKFDFGNNSKHLFSHLIGYQSMCEKKTEFPWKLDEIISILSFETKRPKHEKSFWIHKWMAYGRTTTTTFAPQIEYEQYCCRALNNNRKKNKNRRMTEREREKETQKKTVKEGVYTQSRHNTQHNNKWNRASTTRSNKNE